MRARDCSCKIDASKRDDTQDRFNTGAFMRQLAAGYT